MVVMWDQERRRIQTSKMQDKMAAQLAASRQADIECRFVAASERASAPAPGLKADAENDCINHHQVSRARVNRP